MRGASGDWSFFPAREATGAFWGEWDELNRRLWAGHPFLDRRFVEPLLDYWGTGDEQIVACRGGEGLVAAAILVRRRPGFWQTFLPAQTQMAPVLVGEYAVAREMLAAIQDPAVAIDFLCQDPRYSPFAPGEDRKEMLGVPYAVTMAVNLDGGFQEYSEGRSRNLRKNIGKYRRRAEALGGSPELRRVSAVTELREAVARYGEIESRGWKGQQGTALNENNAQGKFYAAVMELFGAGGRADVFELWIGGRLAASRLLIGNEGFRIVLKTTYDEEMSEYAPGRLLLYEMLKHLAGLPGPKRVEFYTKATREQLAWATEQRTVFHAGLYRWAALRRVAEVVRGIRRNVWAVSEPGEASDGTED